MKIKLFKIFGISKSSPRREIHHNSSIPQKIGKTQIHKVTLHLKEMEKKTANRSYTKQKKRLNKDLSRSQ